MRYALDATQAILNEVELHLQFCREWGIEEQEVRKTPESSRVSLIRVMYSIAVCEAD
ncbi:putative transcription activator [Actinobacillus pleuropneumoniae]|nr:putative transcription activator [Actinobacillus pleuropneumoniae]